MAMTEKGYLRRVFRSCCMVHHIRNNRKKGVKETLVSPARNDSSSSSHEHPPHRLVLSPGSGLLVSAYVPIPAAASYHVYGHETRTSPPHFTFGNADATWGQ